jgi:hypothetical protein
MTLTELRATVRRDLKDEDDEDRRWSDDELDRHIDHAVREFSWAVPREAEATLPTVEGSREVDITSLADLVMIQSVEYPVDQVPRCYRRFEVWGGTLVLLDGDLPDVSDCGVHYGGLHTLDDQGSSIPARFEDLVATGAEAYALMEWGAFTVNRVSLGGEETSAGFMSQGGERLDYFRNELRRWSYRNRLRMGRFYPL